MEFESVSGYWLSRGQQQCSIPCMRQRFNVISRGDDDEGLARFLGRLRYPFCIPREWISVRTALTTYDKEKAG